MIRVLTYFAVVVLVALGTVWLADHPGTVLVTTGGREYQTSTLVALVALIGACIVVLLAWSILRFVFRIPSLLSLASDARRRQRGLKALSRGMVAIGAGDKDAASRCSIEASRYLGNEPMALLLKAQAAQLAGDREAAERTFTEMLAHPETRALGLRGLHIEAQRRGDADAAFSFADEALKTATLPWAGQAVLQYRAQQHDWAAALAAVERNAGGRSVDRATANRQRAVLNTAMAQDIADRDPDEALKLLRDALKAEPTLVPAAALAGRLLAHKGDIRRAAKLIETAYAATPHPELAEAYIGVRPGDAAADRLARAETLASMAPEHPESRMAVARAALEAREFEAARRALAPLIGTDGQPRPTMKACLLMADIEEAEHGETGALYEWLQRASRAPRDPAWVADGVISDHWSPVSPVTGKLDAFVWTTPVEQLSAPIDLRALRHKPEVPQDGPLFPPRSASPGADGPAVEEPEANSGPDAAPLARTGGNEFGSQVESREPV